LGLTDAEIQELEDLLALKEQADICRDSLYQFVVYFWDVLIKNPMVDNWHIKALCDELQPHMVRAMRGEKKIGDIIVNICPGTTKSTIISQMLPAWAWAVMPEAVIISSTGSAQLTTKNAMRSRDIIQSKKYKELYPDINIRKDVSAKTFYENTKGGVRYAFTTNGKPIGNHAHIILIDDPESQKEARSKVMMQQSQESLKGLSTRMIDKQATIMVLLAQRLSKIDSTSMAFKTFIRPQHICLPAEVSDLVKPEKFKEKYIDGLLDPVRLSREILIQEKQKLNNDDEETSEDDYPAQFDQNPTSSKGLVYQLKTYRREDVDFTDSINIGACDVADQGNDYLSAPFAKIVGKKVYIDSVLYTQDGSDITIPELAVRIGSLDLIKFIIETNNQGSVFYSQLKDKQPNISGYVSKGNKMQRIIAHSSNVSKCFYFLEEGTEGYTPEYHKFFKSLKLFLKTAKKEDDAADSITILAKYLYVNYKSIFL